MKNPGDNEYTVGRPVPATTIRGNQFGLGMSDLRVQANLQVGAGQLIPAPQHLI